MQLQGKAHLARGIEDSWKFLSDPSQVIQCAPGLQEYKVGEGKRVSAIVKVSIGFIRGSFQTSTRLLKEDSANHEARLELNGSGAGSGFNAVVTLRISPAGSESELEWQADVNMNGPLGSLAKPLIEGNVKKIIDQLFDCVKSKLA